MVCPCVLPLLATTTAGGALVARKKKQLMWMLISITLVFFLGYVFYLWQMKKQKRSCTICQKSNKKQEETKDK